MRRRGNKDATRASQDNAAIIAIAIGLFALVFIAFYPTLSGHFLNYDDNFYVYDNPEITTGLSLHGVAWAFTHVHADNWHPLTTISHMLDCTLYGLHPWGHHFTNVLLHATASVLLFLGLFSLTKKHNENTLWQSALVAVLFAIHPLRVASRSPINLAKESE